MRRIKCENGKVLKAMFEQSGTFKNEYTKLGYESYDFIIGQEQPFSERSLFDL